MGRKGVSKRKKAKQKTSPGTGSTLSGNGHKIESQPEQVTEKSKPSPKEDNKKRR